ncbi:anaerobic benzoate catabolism transcriptional regulator [Neisseria animaloris]|uniref:helix-turn-helix domain-containing protein n=1 Tax=Neisseria animaloris TaxID=326522 RepID=UPI000A18BA4B|nr:helix-turn-helix transcriptional regulator [Neisseria animaloris]OSI08737.1 transcriptional regulator [Neisseria animaloris]VEH87300.1 anaerobic benzoate catabolism transcriptional regulator [Neisseria animaloris]
MYQIRCLKGISHEELVFEVGISKTYICKIERGSRAVSIDIMGRIAVALELPLEELLQRDLAKLGRLK